MRSGISIQYTWVRLHVRPSVRPQLFSNAYLAQPGSVYAALIIRFMFFFCSERVISFVSSFFSLPLLCALPPVFLFFLFTLSLLPFLLSSSISTFLRPSFASIVEQSRYSLFSAHYFIFPSSALQCPRPNTNFVEKAIFTSWQFVTFNWSMLGLTNAAMPSWLLWSSSPPPTANRLQQTTTTMTTRMGTRWRPENGPRWRPPQSRPFISGSTNNIGAVLETRGWNKSGRSTATISGGRCRRRLHHRSSFFHPLLFLWKKKKRWNFPAMSLQKEDQRWSRGSGVAGCLVVGWGPVG